jgi:hypothetical protein
VLVLALNVTAVGDVATLVARSARLIAGRPVTLRVRRGDSTLDLRARAVGARSRRRPASRSTAGRWTR